MKVLGNWRQNKPNHSLDFSRGSEEKFMAWFMKTQAGVTGIKSWKSTNSGECCAAIYSTAPELSMTC